MTMLWWHLWRLRSGNRSARVMAAHRLGIAKDARAVGPLLEALKDKDHMVSMMAGDDRGLARGRVACSSVE